MASRQPSLDIDKAGAAAKLCERCQKVPFDDAKHGGFAARSDLGFDYLKLDHDDKWRFLPVDFDLADSWPDLKVLSASAAACQFCHMLRLSLKEAEFKVEFESGKISVKLSYAWRCVGRRFALFGLNAAVNGFQYGEEEKTQHLVRLRFTIDADDGPCQQWLRIQPTPPNEILGQENVSRITALLPKSETPQHTSFFPTRVLDLEYRPKHKEEEPVIGRVRLASREEVLGEGSGQPPYVALSYCWGPPEQASTQSITTSGNIQARMSDIDLQTASMVIRDAVAVCRKFRVRYLWIDALCIIQDDSHDWQRESAVMGKIFRNAYFTIGAAFSKSCHESFLSAPLSTIEFPFSSSINPAVKGTYRAVARGAGSIPHVWEKSYEDIEGSWMGRGWVVQEKTLARRLLLFGATSIRVEFGNDFTLFHRLGEETPLNYDFWRGFTESYSNCLLTFDKDRLPAISGVARFFAEATGDQYLAGMWRRDLWSSLFWTKPGQEHNSLSTLLDSLKSPNKYLAPSWSWARDMCYSAYAFGTFCPSSKLTRQPQPLCKILDAGCVVTGLNPFGEVESGFIVVSAKVSTLELDLVEIGQQLFTHQMWQAHIDGVPVVEFGLDWTTSSKTVRQHELLLLLLGCCIDNAAGRCICGGDSKPLPTEGGGSHPPDQEDSNVQEAADRDGDQYCTKCSEPVETRTAYGLLLCQARARASTFYRVGTFNSQPAKHFPHGGLKFCTSWETQTVTII
ncbi:heterokaryon incompatibility protein-domain-containing protein [Lasiosphaeria ovina]|uniref:Heterokaryon incompatibility protein-domain-containing protein n=1 Tax=Lasiosphaeria ovina TaxID=92902 RepID=A0AAE0KCB7_9PEZI|nr:heterokaryon incompatibility protein-domain-containing protein [Lasiosphaeria ovina]